MRRLLIIVGALLLLAAPATIAVAKTSKADRREAQKECRAERGTTDATREAFKAKYRNFGACVSQRAHEANAERKQAKRAAKRECRDEGLKGREFGKCVSQKAKTSTAVEQAAVQNAAKKCKAERADPNFAAGHGGKTFAQFYGTNGNLRNAFGKCVSSLAKAEAPPA